MAADVFAGAPISFAPLFFSLSFDETEGLGSSPLVFVASLPAADFFADVPELFFCVEGESGSSLAVELFFFVSVADALFFEADGAGVAVALDFLVVFGRGVAEVVLESSSFAAPVVSPSALVAITQTVARTPRRRFIAKGSPPAVSVVAANVR